MRHLLIVAVFMGGCAADNVSHDDAAITGPGTVVPSWISFEATGTVRLGGDVGPFDDVGLAPASFQFIDVGTAGGIVAGWDPDPSTPEQTFIWCVVIGGGVLTMLHEDTSRESIADNRIQLPGNQSVTLRTNGGFLMTRVAYPSLGRRWVVLNINK